MSVDNNNSNSKNESFDKPTAKTVSEVARERHIELLAEFKGKVTSISDQKLEFKPSSLSKAVSATPTNSVSQMGLNKEDINKSTELAEKNKAAGPEITA